MTADPAAFLALANDLAETSGAILRRYFRQPIAVDDKSDASPVTVADREVEQALRSAISRAFPDHGILGEEFGTSHADADYVWVLDPIDGTKSFITGKATFGTLIALAYKGVPILGVIDQPITRERWVGVDGRPTTFNGAPIRTRQGVKLPDALLYATTPQMFEDGDLADFARLTAQVKYPLYGADCYAYGLLASGFTDLVCEASLKPYDYCALAPVVAGAGGRITDWQDKPLTIASGPRVLAAGDASLHAQALAVLAGHTHGR
ncbi:MAG TPA: histidinol-phosphatase [Alphaproteobacteria bacterium]|jgi:inositol-phosphate phosphatase/L-galactose 1-phosphate phosphatase/histidinol-phosphatase